MSKFILLTMLFGSLGAVSCKQRANSDASQLESASSNAAKYSIKKYKIHGRLKGTVGFEESIDLESHGKTLVRLSIKPAGDTKAKTALAIVNEPSDEFQEICSTYGLTTLASFDANLFANSSSNKKSLPVLKTIYSDSYAGLSVVRIVKFIPSKSQPGSSGVALVEALSTRGCNADNSFSLVSVQNNRLRVETGEASGSMITALEYDGNNGVFYSVFRSGSIPTQEVFHKDLSDSSGLKPDLVFKDDLNGISLGLIVDLRLKGSSRKKLEAVRDQADNWFEISDHPYSGGN